ALGFIKEKLNLKILKKWQYIWRLKSANRLAKKKGYKSTGVLKGVKSPALVEKLIDEISSSIPRDYIPKLKANVGEPISSYGGGLCKPTCRGVQIYSTILS
ncbi:hypothetical protein ACONZ3_004630, partial [Vibrio parahaemolyticus]|nr:hypothetical protein [Vibrio parahaemolyticus]